MKPVVYAVVVEGTTQDRRGIMFKVRINKNVVLVPYIIHLPPVAGIFGIDQMTKPSKRVQTVAGVGYLVEG